MGLRSSGVKGGFRSFGLRVLGFGLFGALGFISFSRVVLGEMPG